MKTPIKKNTVKKRSVFCQEKKNTNVVDVAVLSPEGIWILCKGRPYCDGKCRYWINGREGLVRRIKWKLLNPLWSDEKKLMEVCSLNCRVLEINHPIYHQPEGFRRDYYPYPNTNIRDLIERYRDVLQEVPAVEVEEPAPTQV